MAEIQTRPTGAEVDAFLDTVADDRRRADAHVIRTTMERITGEPATMWGPAIVGFGLRDGFLAIGFSPRKAALTLYGVYDEAHPDAALADLGPHTTGKGCLYLKRLDAVDADVLAGLIARAWGR